MYVRNGESKVVTSLKDSFNKSLNDNGGEFTFKEKTIFISITEKTSHQLLHQRWILPRPKYKKKDRVKMLSSELWKAVGSAFAFLFFQIFGHRESQEKEVHKVPISLQFSNIIYLQTKVSPNANFRLLLIIFIRIKKLL